MALTKTVDGKPLAKDQFAYVGDADDISTWHLPVDDDHIDSAVKMFGKEQHVPASAKAATARKIAAKAKAKGIDTSDFEAKCCGTQHADFGNGWVEIFRAGSYGDKGQFSADDLDRVVENYNPATHEAPACIGHPKDNLPAYGWANELKRQGDTLLAKFKEVDPAFEDAVKAGRFKKRSAAFYLDSSGKIAGLRHVAFLGAQPPEVKGLKNLSFDDSGRSFTAIDFGEEEAVDKNVDKTVKDQIKEFFAEMFGPKGADKTFSEDEAKRIASAAAEAATAPLKAQIETLQTELKTSTAKFAEREAALAGGEVKRRARAAEARLKTAGKWVPAFEKQGLGLVFDELAKVTTTIEFGEGDAKKSVTPLETLVMFLEGLPKIVPGGGPLVQAHGGRAQGKGTGDPLTDAAKARQKEKNITFGEALKQISEEQPELTMVGASAGGQV